MVCYRHLQSLERGNVDVKDFKLELFMNILSKIFDWQLFGLLFQKFGRIFFQSSGHPVEQVLRPIFLNPKLGRRGGEVGGEGSGCSRQEAQEDQGSPGGPGVNLIKLFFCSRLYLRMYAISQCVCPLQAFPA